MNLFQYALFFAAGRWRATFSKPTPLSLAPDLDRPDLQIVFRRRGECRHVSVSAGHGFALSVVHLYPKSRGRVTLASPDRAFLRWSTESARRSR